MNKALVWKIDFAIGALIFVGFEVIDHSLSQLEQVPFYYDYLSTAKWLLVAGFTFHGIVNWLISRSR